MGLLQDICVAARTLYKSRGLTLLVMLTAQPAGVQCDRSHCGRIPRPVDGN